MTENKSGRAHGEFSTEFARKLNGVLAEGDKPPTGQQLARALKRNDGYVSERKNAKRSWTVDDIDAIAEVVGTDGLSLMAAVLERMDRSRVPVIDAGRVEAVRPEAPVEQPRPRARGVKGPHR